MNSRKRYLYIYIWLLNAFLVVLGKKEQRRNKSKERKTLKHLPLQEARRGPVMGRNLENI